MRSPVPAQPDWRRVLVIAAAIGPYLNALTAGFAFDDGPVIRENPVITGPFDLWALLSAPSYPKNLYRPLTMLSYALNWHLTPDGPALFHAVNIALHAGVSVLVYRLGLALLRHRDAALVAALLFAVHPVHTEAVTGTVGRAELLAAFFGLLALRATLARRDGRRGGDALAVLALTAAVLSKESALTIWLLIPLCRAAHAGGSLWPALARELRSGQWLWFGLPVALLLVSRSVVIGSLGLPTAPSALDNVLAHVPTVVRIGTALAIVTDYASLLLMPLVLSADYSYAQALPLGTWWSLRLLCGVTLLLASLGSMLSWGRTRPALAVTVAFPVVTLALTANVLFPIGTVKAERLLYLPSAGIALCAAALVHRARAGWRSRRAGILLAIVLVGYSVRTWVRNRDWTDNLTLFGASLQAAPRSAKVHHNLAVVLDRAGRDTEAAIHYREALRLYPPYDDAAFGLALQYARKGLTGGAIDWYRKTLAINSRHADANNNLCGALFVSADFAAAEQACRHALLFKPADANLLKVLGATMLERGEHERGVGVLRRALAVNPSDSDIRAMLARFDASDQPAA
jgi:Flp pilus assembly protein TadD